MAMGSERLTDSVFPKVLSRLLMMLTKSDTLGLPQIDTTSY